MSTELQSLITVSVDGYGSLGVFDTKTGGDSDTKPVLHRPGGMGVEIAYPALPTFSNIVVERVLDNVVRSDSATIAALKPFAGRAGATVTEQPLDANGNAFGSPTVARGILGDITIGKADSTSDAVRMWGCTIVVTTTN